MCTRALIGAKPPYGMRAARGARSFYVIEAVAVYRGAPTIAITSQHRGKKLHAHVPGTLRLQSTNGADEDEAAETEEARLRRSFLGWGPLAGVASPVVGSFLGKPCSWVAGLCAFTACEL